jgi:hypothetical protein
MSTDDRRRVVPYTTRWSAEDELRGAVIERRDRLGISFADETLGDRDRRGVLWERALSSPGEGRPQFGKVHSGRQRRAMRNLLCQVCAGPADHDERGTLWLLPDYPGYHTDWPGWPENLATPEPPICLRCAHIAVAACPALRKGSVALRVGRSTISGIRGTLYRPGPFVPKPVDVTLAAYDDPLIPWICAAHLVRELFACTVGTTHQI